jgi:membrane associated rhomboid family serine protease
MTEHFFHTVQTIAGGVGAALAVVNGFWSPTDSQNWLAALVGAALGIILVWLSRRKDA